MPELPEVEHMRRVVAEACVGHKITSATADADDIVFDITKPAVFAASLVGRRVTGVDRYGWFTLPILTNPTHLHLHLFFYCVSLIRVACFLKPQASSCGLCLTMVLAQTFSPA
eukprot:Opistho-2@74171